MPTYNQKDLRPSLRVMIHGEGGGRFSILVMGRREPLVPDENTG
jgi:hypothetical protein